ncbi:pyruvate dehydrogenase complex subunit PDH-E3II [Toxoplasma gondii GAB2-2007-GAL-DOM2]|uniref:Dihydrolipoyl dehydrogenase n=3 Tax=Toxoplasma gondii TaxID=5811 RepID=B9QF24_TOXGV|nr:pyruvate dehydrogenase complex subunit PDH-E3II [Toxoplasma gondii VEG]KFG32118.1 pyruvate dehydrogenase complex subunit PDH-E3II [Toxoplasma gondii GAB2-2007-GAL-DOM2]CEL73617.1 TPA: dihydrolipoyl dehydrogenase, putative [Toxoplasma gondii VEG]
MKAAVFRNLAVAWRPAGSSPLLSQKNQGLSFSLLPSAVQRRGFASAGGKYDVVVVGGGPGGYVAAIKAAQLGLKTACVEKRGTLGGTCLNVGCIPSKAVLNISNKYVDARDHFERLGIKIDGLSIDIDKMQKQKQKVVSTLTQGIEHLFRRNGVNYYVGEGKLTDSNSVEVTPNGKSEKQRLDAGHIILATGSEASPLPGNVVPIDEKVIISSTGALALDKVPKRMAVIGGGVIGLELGSVWRNLGAEVTVVEFLDRLLPPVDGEVAKAFQKEMEKTGIKFQLGTKVVGADVRESSATLHVEPAKGGNPFEMEADVVLVAVGRRPYTKNLGLEELGIETDRVGRVVVDDRFCVPNYQNIRAIGDLIRGPMLAHKAEEEGIACVEMIAGVGEGHVNYETIPSVIYTHPEIAGVGKTEEELKANGVSYNKGTFPFAANSRARANDVATGFVKVLAHKDSDKLLGAWIMGPEAGELIGQLVLGMEYGAAAEDLGRTCVSHPTLSEAVKEACMACYDKPIHMA